MYCNPVSTRSPSILPSWGSVDSRSAWTETRRPHTPWWGKEPSRCVSGGQTAGEPPWVGGTGPSSRPGRGRGLHCGLEGVCTFAQPGARQVGKGSSGYRTEKAGAGVRGSPADRDPRLRAASGAVRVCVHTGRSRCASAMFTGAWVGFDRSQRRARSRRA